MFVCSISNFMDVFMLGVAVGVIGFAVTCYGYLYFMNDKKHDHET